MKKDIFIDNNIAKNFANPMDVEYKKLVQWLMRYNPQNLPGDAYLLVSNKLLGEYSRTAFHGFTATCIPIIIDQLTREGRLIKVSNTEIKEFQREHFTKKIVKIH